MYQTLLRGCSALLLMLGACGPSVSSDDVDASGAGDPCSAGESRCVISSFQECVNGAFAETQDCSGQSCDPTLGCVACRPSQGTTCVGDEVHTCNGDGSIGGFVETCPEGTCSNGGCSEDCGATGAELIYVVDDTYRLWSFDPTKLPADPYTLMGNLSCPAGTALPGHDPTESPATPFSMSVDRNAVAWVLYNSGELFRVDTQNPTSCTAVGNTVGQAGFELFGMGFVADTPGGGAETLYIAGGAAELTATGTLGIFDTGSLTATSIGTHPSGEYSPELTGTGDAKLYGYFPATTGTNMVMEINKSTAAGGTPWNLAPICDSGDLFCSVRAWAFAHWGGQFYIFITVADILSEVTTAKVVLLEQDGTNAVIPGLENTAKIVVGAGVSTCAPIYVP